MANEQRQHTRTPIKMVVQLTFDQVKGLKVETWDISNGGIGIQLPETSITAWVLGMEVRAKVIGLPVDGPELTLKVMNINGQRIGLKIV
ncbi:PilZ domain-containing protein [Reinekea sp.]|jgi:hypothetical protein|uniref:PilZ domain-containing protein n=1 Tax=Reinekea sp. TaxID=1970455 RepID=UPI002A832FEC|nr:PilZ domain-containing protein [Reinekea sp.]